MLEDVDDDLKKINGKIYYTRITKNFLQNFE